MVSSHTNRVRLERRHHRTIPIRFSVNNGPVHYSETINFTHHSLALCTNVKVKLQDRIEIMLNEWPLIRGYVVRNFDEGFAIKFDSYSAAFVSCARSSNVEEFAAPGQQPEQKRRIVSPCFLLAGEPSAYGRFASWLCTRSDAPRNHLLLRLSEALDIATGDDIWLCIKDARWVLQYVRPLTVGGKTMIVAKLNDWQLRLAANNGFSICAVNAKHKVWSFEARPEPAFTHWEKLRINPNIILADDDDQQSSLSVFPNLNRALQAG